MIRCFKCSALAAQGPDGVIHMSCECFPPNLIRSDKGVYTAIPAESFTISTPKWIADSLQYCPACGAPLLQPEHKCRKVEPESIILEPKLPTEQVVKQVDKDTLKFEHVKRLALFMIEHEKICEKCLFFAERGSKVRCAEYLNMDKVCSKWQKRIGVKV